MSTGHRAARRVRGCCCSLTFTDQHTLLGTVSSSGTFGPSLPCLFLCLGHLEEKRQCQPVPSSWQCPACTPNSPTAAPVNPNQQEAGARREIAWSVLFRAPLTSHTHTNPFSSIVLKLCSVSRNQMEIVCTKSCAVHQ